MQFVGAASDNTEAKAIRSAVTTTLGSILGPPICQSNN
jgi:hypothetical protein